MYYFCKFKTTRYNKILYYKLSIIINNNIKIKYKAKNIYRINYRYIVYKKIQLILFSHPQF